MGRCGDVRKDIGRCGDAWKVAVGCFFMLQQAPTNNSGQSAVYGEFVEECEVTGGL